MDRAGPLLAPLPGPASLAAALARAARPRMAAAAALFALPGVFAGAGTRSGG